MPLGRIGLFLEHLSAHDACDITVPILSTRCLMIDDPLIRRCVLMLADAYRFPDRVRDEHPARMEYLHQQQGTGESDQRSFCYVCKTLYTFLFLLKRFARIRAEFGCSFFIELIRMQKVFPGTVLGLQFTELPHPGSPPVCILSELYTSICHHCKTPPPCLRSISRQIADTFICC